MITLARLDGSRLTINADLIEFVEATPDTVISLTSGRRIIVKEPVDEVIRQAIEYKRHILAGICSCHFDCPWREERSHG